GGALGLALARYMVNSLNLAGALLTTATLVVVSFYLVSTFTIEKATDWLRKILDRMRASRDAWLARRAAAAKVRKAARPKKASTMVVASTTPAVASPAEASMHDTPPWQERLQEQDEAAVEPQPEEEPEP